MIRIQIDLLVNGQNSETGIPQGEYRLIKEQKRLIFLTLKKNTMNELKDMTFASILELDTKSKIEIYRILKRHAATEKMMESYDEVLTRLKNNKGLAPA